MPNPPHEQRRRQAPPAGVGCIAVSFRPAIPRRVAPQQRPLALRRPRQSTSKLHSGTIEAGQPVPIFLSHPWGAVHQRGFFWRSYRVSRRLRDTSPDFVPAPPRQGLSTAAGQRETRPGKPPPPPSVKPPPPMERPR